MWRWILASVFLLAGAAYAAKNQASGPAAVVSYVANYSGATLEKADASEKISSYDFSGLLTGHQDVRYGFIGKNFQRFDIHFTSVKKDAKDPRVYQVEGKTRVKSNICDFKGTMRLVETLLWKEIEVCEDEPKPKMQGVAFFSYSFAEDRRQKGSGVFEGYAASRWLIDQSGTIEYDIEDCSDGAFNNSFVGTWRSYATKATKVCNWGEHRIPYCGNLDNGADGFAPAAAYAKYGWSTFDPEQASEDRWWE